MALTEQIVREMVSKPDRADLMKSDGKRTGLWFRVRNGKGRWYLQWRDDAGRQRRLQIGEYPVMKLTAARETAATRRQEVKNADPHQAKRQRRADAKRTFGVVVAEYLEDRRPLTAEEPKKAGKKRLKARSYAEVRRHLMSHSKSLHSEPVDSITVADVHDLIRGIGRKAPVAADAVRTSLVAFFAWAIKSGRAKQNPAATTEAPIDRKDHQRDRWLSDDELRAIWPHLRDDDYGRLMRILALTGQRRSEAGGIRWSEIDGLVWPGGAATFDVDASAGAVWIVPAARAKNGEDHPVPLSRQCLDILASVPRRDDRDLVFGRKGPFSGWSRAKDALDGRIAEAREKAGLPNIEPWIAHDFRRTFATNADDRLGVMPFVVDVILSHKQPSSGPKLSGTAKVYNRSKYMAEKRQALDMWGDHLLAIVENRPSNVVPLRKGIAA